MTGRSRRTLLGDLGVALSAGIAGCSVGGPTGGDGTASDPETTERVTDVLDGSPLGVRPDDRTAYTLDAGFAAAIEAPSATMRTRGEIRNVGSEPRVVHAVNYLMADEGLVLGQVGTLVDRPRVGPGGSFAVSQSFPVADRVVDRATEAIMYAVAGPPEGGDDLGDPRGTLVSNTTSDVGVVDATSGVGDDDFEVTLTVENTGDEAIDLLDGYQFQVRAYDADGVGIAIQGGVTSVGTDGTRPGERSPVTVSARTRIGSYRPDAVESYLVTVSAEDF